MLQLSLRKNHNERRNSDDRSMTDIAKHDSKQERECDHCKEARVDFLVTRRPIAVHNRLKALRELVGPNK